MRFRKLRLRSFGFTASRRRSADLIITGTVTREDKPPLRVSSIAMQAKLCGLHFTLEDGVLGTLPVIARNLGYAT